MLQPVVPAVVQPFQPLSAGPVRWYSPARLSAPAASCPVPQVARHGNMIVGKTGSGKTEAWKCLQRALLRLKKEEPDDERFQRVHVHTINPLALSNDELYGCFEEATHEWQVGRAWRLGGCIGAVGWVGKTGGSMLPNKLALDGGGKRPEGRGRAKVSREG